MAVGAGSIKRASKLNAAAEETVKKEAAPVKEEIAETKAEEIKKAPAKKPAAKKPAAPKKTAAKTEKPKAETEKPIEEKSAAPLQKPIGNVACHLTEELPVHLL